VPPPIPGTDASELHEIIVLVAGPFVNLLFAGISFLLVPPGGYLVVMGTAGFSMNLCAGICTLMPVAPMEGAQVFRRNRVLWAVIWIPIFLVYCSFLFFRNHTQFLVGIQGIVVFRNYGGEGWHRENQHDCMGSAPWDRPSAGSESC
jgi:Zn-dependent protease